MRFFDVCRRYENVTLRKDDSQKDSGKGHVWTEEKLQDLQKDKKMEDEKIADEATFSTEKILTTLIEKLIAKALNEQQKNLLNIATGNSEISKQQIAELKK